MSLHLRERSDNRTDGIPSSYTRLFLTLRTLATSAAVSSRSGSPVPVSRMTASSGFRTANFTRRDSVRRTARVQSQSRVQLQRKWHLASWRWSEKRQSLWWLQIGLMCLRCNRLRGSRATSRSRRPAGRGVGSRNGECAGTLGEVVQLGLLGSCQTAQLNTRPRKLSTLIPNVALSNLISRRTIGR